MSGLGDRCRELMRLKLQGKAFPEIQKIMGVAAINTIYTWDHRCRKNLLEAMGGSWEPQAMSPEDIKKLLGGYATGTLTAEEQQALFAAALEDQELFDALAREQALRDLLSDPASRGRNCWPHWTQPGTPDFHFWRRGWRRRRGRRGRGRGRRSAELRHSRCGRRWAHSAGKAGRSADRCAQLRSSAGAHAMPPPKCLRPQSNDRATRRSTARGVPPALLTCPEPAAEPSAPPVASYSSRGAAQSRIPCRRRGGQGSPSASGTTRPDGAQGRSQAVEQSARRNLRSHVRKCHTRRATRCSMAARLRRPPMRSPRPAEAAPRTLLPV